MKPNEKQHNKANNNKYTKTNTQNDNCFFLFVLFCFCLFDIYPSIYIYTHFLFFALFFVFFVTTPPKYFVFILT